MGTVVAEHRQLPRRVLVAGVAVAVALTAAVGFVLGRGGAADSSSAASAVAAITVTEAVGGTENGGAIVMNQGGELVTAYHLVTSAERIAVLLAGRHYWASPIGLDPADDLAVLALLGASNLSTEPVDGTARLHVGDGLTVLEPAGTGAPPRPVPATVTALGRTLTASDRDWANPLTVSSLIEFTAQSPPVGAGGAVLDSSGKAVAMVIAGSDRLRGAAGPDVGYALPMTTVSAIASTAEGGAGDWRLFRGTGGFLGIDVGDAPENRGAYVLDVPVGTPAYVAGITVGDVIVAVDGSPVTTAGDLASMLHNHRGGDRVGVTYLDSDGGRHVTPVQLAAATPP